MSALIATVPSWVIPVLILATSILALTIIFERGWILIRRIPAINPIDQKQLLAYLKSSSYVDAMSFCRLQSHPSYNVILAILESRDEKIDLRAIADEESLRQLSYLEKYLSSLGTIATVAPLFGLLGTVTGMIKSFRVFEQSASKSAQLMGGIDEALITTALGLIVAIPSLIMYNFYIRKLNTITEETEVLVKLVLSRLTNEI